MSNQDNNGNDFEDDIYDEILDDSFEDDFDADYAEAEAQVASEVDDLDEYDEFDSDEDWDSDEDFDDEGGEAAGAQKKKRRFDMSFNKMAISGALILGVGVLIFQVMTKKPIVSMDQFVSSVTNKGVTDDLLFKEDRPDDGNVASDGTVEETKGFLYDSEILDSMEIKDTPPMPSTIAQEIPEEKAEPLGEFEKPDNESVEIPRPPEDAQDINVDLADLINQPEEETPSKAEEFLQEKINERIEEVVEVKIAEPIKPAEIEKKVEAVAEPKVEPKKPEVKKVEPVVVEVKPVQEVAPISSEVSADISATLNMIVSRLDNMETKINEMRASGDTRIEDISENIDNLKEQLQSVSAAAPAAEKRKQVKEIPKAVKKTTPKKKAVVKKASKPKRAAPNRTTSWELRAAQPGKAWVSKRGQKSMRPVVIGDTLSGVGRITNISYVGGRWLVQGTSGQIKQ